ncbi:MAG: PAS domain-containing protein [Chromatiales bacterium]|nr:PAS domain-containing protein [Chromatiales bacterium]
MVVADAPAIRHVLVLFSEERFMPANLAVNDSLQATLTAGSAERIEFYTEFLELARFPGEQQEQAFQQFLREKYADRKLAVLIAVGAPALEFLVKYRATLFPDTPIVFCGVEQREIDALDLGPRIIGVPVKVDFTATLELALRLQPDTRRVVVVSGAAAMDRTREAEARQLFRPYEDRLAFTYLTGLPMPDLLGELAHLPEHTVIIYLSILRDGVGTAFVPRDALERLRQAANAPIYGLYETYLGHGIVGGRLLSFAQQGKQAARLGRRILAGEQPAAIAVPEAGANSDSFDWRQLRRWGISEDRLPPGSSVQFKEPSVWDQHKWLIIGTLALCLGEALLIVALLVQQRRRRQAEKALRDGEERMNLAASSAELGMWWWDIARDQIEATEKCRALYGFAPAVPLNYPAFLNTLHPDDREPTHQAIQQALVEQTEFHGEYRVVRPDGSLRWLAAKGRGYFDSAGKPLRMLGVSINVTERKQVELEAQRQRQELAHMMRVVTLGELSAALAHELNQPLTAILSNAQAAQRFLAQGGLERKS